ncbi:MAG: hypothetical protein ACRC2T_03945 [Thermoguttaceae bacterium]
MVFINEMVEFMRNSASYVRKAFPLQRTVLCDRQLLGYWAKFPV